MISEILKFWTTRASRAARNLGYVYSSIALEKRAQRQAKDWQSHVNECSLLWSQILDPNIHKRIAVLGSGPLTELPLEFILENCEELHLVDVVHPAAVRRKLKKNSKVKFHDADVSGVLRWLSGERPNELNFRAPKAPFEVDLVVSANLLSQLSLEPSWYLNKKYGEPLEGPFVEELVEKLNREHIEHLRSYGARKIVLYTDLERSYLDPKGELLEKHDSLVLDEAELGNKIKEWNWKLCPLGEESNKYEIQMRVAAFEITSGPRH